MDSATAAPILCAGVTVYAALKRPKLTVGEWVAISGAGGGLGHLAVQYAHAMGYNVIAIDSGEEKRKLCVEEFGVEGWVDFKTSKDVAEDVKKLTPGGSGAHAVFIVAVSVQAFESAIHYVRPAGSLVIVGLPKEPLPFSIFWAVFKNITIHASYVGTRQDAIESLGLVAAGKVKVVHEIRRAHDLAQVYDDMSAGKIHRRVVLEM